MLEITGLTKTYPGGKKALTDVNLSSADGEIFGFIGHNGAGKTTTLRMIATLIKPEAGEIYVDDTSVMADAVTVRNKIGFLTSELKLEDFFKKFKIKF